MPRVGTRGGGAGCRCGEVLTSFSTVNHFFSRLLWKTGLKRTDMVDPGEDYSYCSLKQAWHATTTLGRATRPRRARAAAPRDETTQRAPPAAAHWRVGWADALVGGAEAGGSFVTS